MGFDHREAADGHAARARELLVAAGDVPEQVLQRAMVEATLAVFHQLRVLDSAAVGSGAGAGDDVAG
ncbi:hypothetical protein [Actinokineospora sp. HUAS TT18]|uniref:hypothetical protein n=1 Tax=Actinokineospora sp. HUAS TT18 TaxID=3447451 RepID=UPI003F51DF80